MNPRVLFLAALAALIPAAPVLAQEGEAKAAPPVWEARVAAKAPSIVNIKFVLKTQMSMMGQSQDEESNQEVQGALLNAKGLVVTSNAHFDPTRLFRIPPQLRDQIQIKATPTDLKVLFGNEEEEYEAQIVASDSNLGLTFIQILDLKGREVSPIDFSAEAEVGIGQELFGVTRLPRGFDCVPAFGRIYISAKVEKPRSMWSFSGDFSSLGLPVYDLMGNAVGIVTAQQGSEGAGGGGGMLGGVRAARPFILPVSSLARSLKAAEERGAQAIEAAKEAAAEEQPAGETGEQPAGEKPAGEQPEEPKEKPDAPDAPKEKPEQPKEKQPSGDE